MNYLLLQPDASLALVRNLWVNVRSQRLPALLARTPHVERLALSIAASRAYGNPRGSVFAAPLPLHELEFVSPGPGFYNSERFYRSFHGPTLRLTHLRLDYMTISNGYWIAHFLPSRGPTLPHLTHLAYDADVAAPPRTTVYYRDLLASRNLPMLKVCVVVIPDGSDARQHADRLLRFRLSRLVVLVDLPEHTRTRDWTARVNGKRGSWERAEALGESAAPHSG